MRDGHQGDAALEGGAQQAHEAQPRAAVLAEGRLVEDQQLGGADERGRHGQAALLAARQRHRVGARKLSEAQGLQVFLDEGGDLLLAHAGGARADGEFLGDGGGQELVLGLLEDHGHAAQELLAAPLVGVACRAVGGLDLDRALQGRQEARQRQRKRRFSGAIRANDAGGDAALDRQVDAGPHGGGLVVADRQVGDAGDGGILGRGRGDLGGGADLGGDVVAGKPDAALAQGVALLVEDLVEGAVGSDATVGHHDDAVHEGRPHVHAMLDDHHRRARASHNGLDGGAHLGDATRIQVRGRLVQEQQARAHRENRRERQALLLPARQLRRRMIKGCVQAHRAQGLLHARPYLLAGNPQVLHTEGHVVTHAGQDHLGLRVLHEEAHAAPRLRRGNAVNGESAGGLALLGATQQARQAAHERRLARPGRPEHQHALTRRDIEINARQRGVLAPSVTPSPFARAHARARPLTQRRPAIRGGHGAGGGGGGLVHGAGIDKLTRSSARGEAVQRARLCKPARDRPGEHARQDNAGQDAEEQVAGVVEHTLLDVALREELKAPLSCESHGASGRDHPHVESAVHERGENNLGTESLGNARIQRANRPLGTQAHRHGRRQQLDEERGTGLADHVAAKRAAQQPDAGRQAIETGGDRLENLVAGAANRVPSGDNEATRNTQDCGSDDVDDPPTEGPSSGSHARILPSRCTAATWEEPSYAGMIRIRFYGRG